MKSTTVFLTVKMVIRSENDDVSDEEVTEFLDEMNYQFMGSSSNLEIYDYTIQDYNF